ncbi:hypothetical protein QJ48_15575 [Paenibacillus sp. A3]|uniref:hypothetical protein n=1 Tax=Paenibacillus sp. A3 TaxID=1337054 RepID=UPI0006D5A2F5|nr:hypothetical protein [Paenibacillus sp. A3]KPV58569.1 hypothetical protein QJ48_15575 [Paenibacillus sp. A3]
MAQYQLYAVMPGSGSFQSESDMKEAVALSLKYPLSFGIVLGVMHFVWGLTIPDVWKIVLSACLVMVIEYPLDKMGITKQVIPVPVGIAVFIMSPILLYIITQ